MIDYEIDAKRPGTEIHIYWLNDNVLTHKKAFLSRHLWFFTAESENAAVLHVCEHCTIDEAKQTARSREYLMGLSEGYGIRNCSRVEARVCLDANDSLIDRTFDVEYIDDFQIGGNYSLQSKLFLTTPDESIAKAYYTSAYKARLYKLREEVELMDERYSTFRKSEMVEGH